MKRFLVVSTVCMLFLGFTDAAMAVESGSCRCSNGIVSLGDAMVEVVAKCGEPTIKSQREEKRILADKKGFSIVTVDEWSYNFGANAFMYSMRFVDGRVERIDSLDTGY